MKKGLNIILSCVGTIISTMIIAVFLFSFLDSLEEQTIIDFLLFSIVLPSGICIVYGIYIGIINKKYSIASIYSIISGIIVSIEINLIMLTKIDAEAIDMLLKNTPDSDSLTVTASSSVGIGNVFSSILIFAVCAAIGGFIGVTIVRKLHRDS